MPPVFFQFIPDVWKEWLQDEPQFEQ